MTVQHFTREAATELTTDELWAERKAMLESRRSIHFLDEELSARGELKTIEIDTVDMDGKLIDWLVEQQLRLGLKARVVDVFGPGGGNPVVEWSGQRSALEQLLREAYEADEDDVRFYLDGE